MHNDLSHQQSRICGILFRPSAHILLIAGMVLVAYANTFHAPFVFDDLKEILDNPIVRDLNFFRNPASALGLPTYHGLKMRTLGYFTLALNYKFGGTDVTGYHIFNLAVHIFTALLVYKLILRTLSLHFLGQTKISRQAPLIALLVALLFAVHPIQTEAVTYVIQRLASLATFFYLLSLTSYIDASLNAEKKRPGMALAWYLLSLASAVAAMKTKEISFTLPVVIALYDFLFLRGNPWRRLSFLLPLLLTMLIIPLSLIGPAKPVGEIISDAGAAARVDHIVSRSAYLCTQFRVVVTYIRMLILPVNQNLDHDYPVHPAFLTPGTFLSFLFLAALFGLAVYFIWISRVPASRSKVPVPNSGAPELRLIGFGILWFFITLSVESSIIPINDIMVEHRLYLPSVGFFLALVVPGWWLVQRLQVRLPGIVKAAAALAGVGILVLAGATFARNLVWQNPLTLWQDAVAKNPRNTRAYNNLGIYYDQKGEYRKAIPYFEKAIAIQPDFSEALFNLGIAYAALKQTDTAIHYYRKALALRPADPKILFNLGVSYIAKGLMEPASEVFQEALRLDPKMDQARMFLDYTRGQMVK